MPIDYDHLISLRAREERFSYQERDALLYALTTGFGEAALERGEVAYVYEGDGLKVCPTFGSALVASGLLEDCGWDASRVVHAGERLVLQRPLPPAATLLVDSQVIAVEDHGRGTGALVITESRARTAVGDDPVFTLQRAVLARADGGFGGRNASAFNHHAVPGRRPDLVARLQTRRNQGLLYRLCAGRVSTRGAGLLPEAEPGASPPLQELCLLGIACRAVLKTICEFDATLIQEFEAGFFTPARAGDTLLVELWQDANVVSFRVRVPERDGVLVLDHGKCVLAT